MHNVCERKRDGKEGKEEEERIKWTTKRSGLNLSVGWCPIKEQYAQIFRVFRLFLKINGLFYTYIIIEKKVFTFLLL